MMPTLRRRALDETPQKLSRFGRCLLLYVQFEKYPKQRLQGNVATYPDRGYVLAGQCKRFRDDKRTGSQSMF